MTYQTLSYVRQGRTGVCTFTRPDALNSLTEDMFADLEAVLSAVEADDSLGALVITGEGKAFCVGLDLDLLERAFDDMAYFDGVVRRLNAIVLRLEALPIPTIAAVNGFARAGGFELTLGCDFMIVADEARIGDAHTDSGVVPACVSLRLKRRVGEQAAKELLWTARWLTAPEAVAYGLALRTAPRDRLTEDAIAFAATMTDKPRAAIASIKSVFQQGTNAGVAEGAEIELQQFIRYMASEPYGREGFRAFREKREPTWRAG